MTRVVVTVMPRTETLDPQGQAVAGALHQLGFDDLGDVRIGKRIALESRWRGHPDRTPWSSSSTS